jgi:hypothetical protein
VSERLCDHCGELPGTEALCDILAYCALCFDESCDEFAVDFGYITREDAEAKRVERARLRATAMAEEAA